MFRRVRRGFCRGLVTTETVVGLALMMLLAGLVADGLFSYRRTSTAASWRRAAVWAADAQLQRYQAGAPFDSPPPAGVVPEEITLHTQREAGREQWEGFDRVTVTATAALPTGKTVQEQVTAYLPAEKRP